VSGKAETELQRAIVLALEALGVTVIRTQAGRVPVRRGWLHLAPEGWPDLTGYLPDGRFLGLEIKVPKGKTDKDRAEKQAAWRARAGAAGCVVGQVDSVAAAVLLVRGALAESRRAG
jgi:hypothetical protein